MSTDLAVVLAGSDTDGMHIRYEELAGTSEAGVPLDLLLVSMATGFDAPASWIEVDDRLVSHSVDSTL